MIRYNGAKNLGSLYLSQKFFQNCLKYQPGFSEAWMYQPTQRKGVYDMDGFTFLEKLTYGAGIFFIFANVSCLAVALSEVFESLTEIN